MYFSAKTLSSISSTENPMMCAYRIHPQKNEVMAFDEIWMYLEPTILD